MTIFRDPLLHFSVAGFVLFLLFAAFGVDTSTDRDHRIKVDREAILTFIQYRTRSFDREMAEKRLEALPEMERGRLVDEYVREEVLFREGLSLGLDSDDYVIRRRLIQKVEFLAEGFADAGAALTEEDLRAHFEANKADYFVSPSITFTHVFFDKTKHGGAERSMAQTALLELNEAHVPFASAPAHGDRFPFHVNYVERTPEFVASHFGKGMSDAVFALGAEEGVWKGIFQSPYGAHLVMVTGVSVGKDARFEDVRARVFEDTRREKLSTSIDTAVNAIRDRYEVEIDLSRAGEGAQ